MHDAAALVCVHGADCMNLMFLPPRGVVVEIDPVHHGALSRQPGSYAPTATHPESNCMHASAEVLRNSDVIAASILTLTTVYLLTKLHHWAHQLRLPQYGRLSHVQSTVPQGMANARFCGRAITSTWPSSPARRTWST